MTQPAATIVSRSVADTFAAAQTLVNALDKAGGSNAVMVALCGPMGAGKTHFVKGLAAALKIAKPEAVRSPTFTLLHTYRAAPPKLTHSYTSTHIPAHTLHHIDLCRLASENSEGGSHPTPDPAASMLTDADLPPEIAEAVADPAAVSAVEWADLMPALWPPRTVVVELDAEDADSPASRTIRITPRGSDRAWAAALAAALTVPLPSE